jgi:protease-4
VASTGREGFWGVVWRTATKSVIVAAVGGITFAIAMLVFVVALVAVIGSVFDGGDDGGLETDFVYGDESASDKLLVVRVDGVILGEKLDEPLFSSGYAYGYEIRRTLQDAAKEDDIRGVLLWMSTPGGTIYGSRAIADGVAEYQATTGNPVVAYVSGLSASGGMYAMSGADVILADHGSMVGSIGVIFGPFAFYDGVVATEGGLLGGGITTTGGITFEYLTAGRSKDVGNPFRPMTDDERAVLQEGLNSEYGEFVNYVAEHRGIAQDAIRNSLGAMIYGNARAQELGLIDGTASLDEAYERLASEAGLKAGEFQVVEESGSGSLFGALVQSGADAESLAAVAAEVHDVCSQGGTYLVYWGDPSTVCWK